MIEVQSIRVLIRDELFSSIWDQSKYCGAQVWSQNIRFYDYVITEIWNKVSSEVKSV